MKIETRLVDPKPAQTDVAIGSDGSVSFKRTYADGWVHLRPDGTVRFSSLGLPGNARVAGPGTVITITVE